MNLSPVFFILSGVQLAGGGFRRKLKATVFPWLTYLCNGSCRQTFRMQNVYRVTKRSWTNSRKKNLWVAIRYKIYKNITSDWDLFFCWLESFTCIVIFLACSSTLRLQTSQAFVGLHLVTLSMRILMHSSYVAVLLFNGRCYCFSAGNIFL